MFESLTQQEIFSQPESLKKTLEYLLANRNTVADFFHRYEGRKMIFMGCGSSAMLAKSARAIFGKGSSPSYALTGGEYLIAPERYAYLFEDSVVILLSRSGMTSEILRAVGLIRETSNAVFLSVTMKENNDLLQLCQLNLLMPWAYDRSVCQTRTVSNLYLTLLMLQAFRASDALLEEAATQAVLDCQRFLTDNSKALEKMGARDFNRAIVLSDGILGGIGEEAALAFTEISMLPGAHFGVLDYRHGPIVLHNAATLTLVLVRPSENQYQQDLLEDLRGTGCILVTVGAGATGTDLDLKLENTPEDSAWGLYLIWTAQMLSLSKALADGKNPDQPKGLEAYITLKQ